MRPLKLKYCDDIEENRIVLYRENCREIMPSADEHKKHASLYVIEISRTKRKLIVVALKIPKGNENVAMGGFKAI